MVDDQDEQKHHYTGSWKRSFNAQSKCQKWWYILSIWHIIAKCPYIIWVIYDIDIPIKKKGWSKQLLQRQSL